MNISYEWYRIFELAARHMSFSQAAKELYVTQSSVSQTIRALEEHLDLPLFFRNGKRISLTPAGQLLYDQLQEAFATVRHAENLLDSYRSLETGQLRIGASDTICKHYLLEIFEEFHRRYPHINLLIDNQPTPKTREEVAAGELDLGFVNHRPEIRDSRFHYSSFHMLRECFFTGKAYAHLADRPLSAETLRTLPLISLKTHTSTRTFLETLFAERGLTLEPEVELISIDLIADLVDIGLGIGFADMKVITDHASEHLRPLQTTFEIPRREIAMIAHASAPLSKAAQAFISLTREMRKGPSV